MILDTQQILDGIKGQLIVSCQALETEPLHSSMIMARMAVAAMKGGAKGIRANSVEDIVEIKKYVDLPIIGIIKRDYEDSDCYITPTMKEIDELVQQANPHIIAIDATKRLHPGKKTSTAFIQEIKTKYPQVILMADISTLEEAIEAEKAGADLVSTTLSGYTPYSPASPYPDFTLMEQACKTLSIPVIGEGRIWSPEEAKKAFEMGIHALVVGSAITRPREITKRFIHFLENGSY